MNVSAVYSFLTVDSQAFRKESKVPVWRPQLWSACHATEKGPEGKGKEVIDATALMNFWNIHVSHQAT